jgi:small subunit ribosomal protein S9
MADEEHTDENGTETPADEPAPAEDAGAEEAAAEDTAAEDAGKQAEDQPEEVQGEETVVEEEPQTQEPGSSDTATEGKAKDTVPGAELDPIQIEPERQLTAEEQARLEAEAEERARREAEATAETSEEEPVARRKLKLPADTRIQATGKRKSSIARVIVRPGEGKFEVNQRNVDDYFPRQALRAMARQALLASGYEDVVDVRARVHGGGISGQAGAVRHGVARALCEIDPELRTELKRRGMLTRDARIKERRKAGLKKARKRPQFSKR